MGLTPASGGMAFVVGISFSTPWAVSTGFFGVRKVSVKFWEVNLSTRDGHGWTRISNFRFLRL
jgi:hypothetical protein